MKKRQKIIHHSDGRKELVLEGYTKEEKMDLKRAIQQATSTAPLDHVDRRPRCPMCGRK